MAEQQAKKGVIVEFDFAVADGSTLLFKAAEKLLGEYEIPFTPRIEAQHLAGGNYQGGLAEYFNIVKTKKTAAKAAKDIATLFAEAMTESFASAVTDDFRAFVRTLLGRGLKVVVATRANMTVAKEALAEFLDTGAFALYEEISPTYGSVKWDDWRRAAAANHLRSYLSIAVAGSGYSVKSALLAGMGTIAVSNPRVAYQDFSGADDVVEKLNATVAEAIVKKLRA